MPKTNIETKTTLEKYNESQSDVIPDIIKLRIKELWNLLWIFFDKAFWKMFTKVDLAQLKWLVEKNFPTVVKLRDIIKK